MNPNISNTPVFSMSIGSSCSFPRVNAKIAILTCLDINNSCMANPLSGSTRSPGNNLSIMPECSVRNLSDVLPAQAFDTNETEPWEVIPTNTLTVLLLLYEEYV